MRLAVRVGELDLFIGLFVGVFTSSLHFFFLSSFLMVYRLALVWMSKLR